MSKRSITTCVHLLCLLSARMVAADSVSDEAAGVASPDMTCKPLLTSQMQLPPANWDTCVGTYTYGNENLYRGEFHRGDREGFGVLQIRYLGPSTDTLIGWKEPAIYIGSFKGGRLNGHGLVIAKSGSAYTGTFRNNIPESDVIKNTCTGASPSEWTNCVGLLHLPDGNVYRGEFSKGRPEGIGLLEINVTGSLDSQQVRLPRPGIYVGEFKGGKLNGHGAVSMSNGGFLGTFRDNSFEAPASGSGAQDVN